MTTKLDLADVTNLQTTLDNTISNPYNGELVAQSYVSTLGNPNKRIRVTEDSVTSDNGAVVAMNTANTINLQATNVLVNGTALPSASNQALNTTNDVTFNSVTTPDIETQSIQSGTTLDIVSAEVNITGNTVLAQNLNVAGSISGFTTITNPFVSITANNSIVLDCVTSVLGLTGNDVSINGTNTNPLATPIMFNGKSQFNNNLNVLGPLVTSGDATFNFGVVQMNGSTIQIQPTGTCQIMPTGLLILKGFSCNGDITLNGNSTVTGLKTPFLNSDAVPRSYADGLIGKHAIYAVSSLPAASGRAATVVYVNDESGGATMAFSDGINWRRVQDRAIVT